LMVSFAQDFHGSKVEIGVLSLTDA